MERSPADALDRPASVAHVAAIAPPTGPGVIFTAARWLPSDGTGEVAYAGRLQPVQPSDPTGHLGGLRVGP